MTDGRLYASTLQSLILSEERHHEIPRLRVVVGMALGSPINWIRIPPTKKPRRDHCSLAAGRDFHQRKGCPQFQGEQFRQGVGCGANLHPQFQRPFRFVATGLSHPTIAPGLKQRLYTPTLGAGFHHSLSQQFRLSLLAQFQVADDRQPDKHGSFIILCCPPTSYPLPRMHVQTRAPVSRRASLSGRRYWLGRDHQ